jgi:hypothetical protein
MERQSRNTRRRSRRLTAQFLVVAVIAAMLLTTLPLSGNQASAEAGQLNENDTATTETVDTATTDEQPEVVVEDPQEEGTPVDGENPQAVENADQNQDQSQDQQQDQTNNLVVPPSGSSSITINKHVCYGEVSGDIYEMAASCDAADQVYTFNLYFGSPMIASSQTNGSLAGFSGLPVGTFYVEEVPSADSKGALVYCKVDDYLGNAVENLRHYEDWNWKIEVNIATDGNMVYCDWFNLKDAPETTTDSGSSITINKHVCFGEVSGDIYEMAASCEGADQVYTFNLRYGIPVIATSQTNGTLAGFSGLENGTYYVGEEPTTDTKGILVYCKVDDFLGNPLQELRHFEDWNWEIEVNIAAEGSMVYCDWFNLKDTPETYGSVVINKIECPAGFDAYSADIYGIAANCHETPAPVNFTLTDSKGGQSTMQTAANPPFTATWDNVPSGALTIAEELPQGFGSPRVFCKNEKYTGEGDAELEVNVSGAVASTELKPGYDVLWCDWVNIPQGEVEIYVNKYLCPEGFYSNDPYELAAECHEYYDPFTFSINSMLTGPSGTQKTGDVVQGGVHFTNLFADTWTVVEDLPADYDEPIIFCKLINVYDGSESDYEMAQVFNGNAISYDIETGYTLYCDWFNFPYEPDYGSITIIKHTCPAGYDVNAYGANPLLDCPELTNGVKFTLYPESGGALDGYTGDAGDGTVYWGELGGADNYWVQETFPADTWYAFVFGCVSDTNPGLAPTDLYALDGNGSLYIERGYVENITCHWYNVPNLHGGTVVITKYWCDGNVYSIYACDIYEQGATFSISGPATGLQVTTGANGMASVDLDAGSYEIDEVGSTWCHAEASNVDNKGRIVVDDGETTYVTVFNCGPRETPKGKPNPGKFPNTGIGPINSEQLAA